MERLHKVLVISGALLTICFCLRAQYLPVVEDGKCWIHYVDCSAHQVFIGVDGYFYYDYLQGDTIVDGRACKKMYYYSELGNAKPYCKAAMYEENGKVYFHTIRPTTGEWELLYDFTLQIGDRLQLYEDDFLEHEIIDIRTINIFGVTRRVFTIGEVEKGVPSEIGGYWKETYWIEGIGGMHGVQYPYFPTGVDAVQTCEKDGVILYTYEAFSELIATSVNKICTDCRVSDLYDLQGRRLAREPEKGLYIKNGRKYLKR